METEMPVSMDLPADVRARLEARAQRLARPPEEAAEGTLGVCVFRMGTERYAVPLSHVLEVIRGVVVAPLPCTPPFIRGVLNLRGRIFSVTDLAVYLGLPPLEEAAAVVLVRHGDMELGLLADDILESTMLDPGVLQPPPATLSARQAAVLQGVTASWLHLLGLERLFAQEGLVVHDDSH